MGNDFFRAHFMRHPVCEPLSFMIPIPYTRLIIPGDRVHAMSEDVAVRAKRLAGAYAAEQVDDGMIVGLGTGSTVLFAMERLAYRIKEEGLRIAGVPTSFEASMRARNCGIMLTTLDEHPQIDLAIDGADQVDPSFCMIKGRGAALLREKCVAEAAASLYIVVDSTKTSDCLDAPVPVEAHPFAASLVESRIRVLGGSPALRIGVKKDGPVITDNGNFVFDCDFGKIDNPGQLETKINNIPGLMASGLFTAFTDKTTVVVGGKEECLVMLPGSSKLVSGKTG